MMIVAQHLLCVYFMPCTLCIASNLTLIVTQWICINIPVLLMRKLRLSESQ